jgi:hypothetical protein
MALALESAASVYAAISTRHYIAAPFAMIFVAGFGYVSYTVLRERMAAAAAAEARRPVTTPAEGTAAAEATRSVTA